MALDLPKAKDSNTADVCLEHILISLQFNTIQKLAVEQH
jgi:hypothetical protein